jgi:serpin B
MRHHLAVLGFLSALAVLASGSLCTAAPPAAPAAKRRVAPPDPAALARLAQGSNAFGFDLYQRLRGTPGNLVISPASLTTALTMTWGGAAGETAAQIGKVLHQEGTADEAMATSGQLARVLQDPARPVVFRIANQLFVERSYPLVPAFLRRMRSDFGAAAEPVDFKGAPERSRSRINRWVEEQTAHRIQDLVPSGGVTAETRLALVNAIYFLGDWAVPFERAATQPAPFHATPAETRDVPTMNRVGGFRVARKDGVSAVELPYKGGGMSMLVLIPDELGGLESLESRLDAGKLEGLVAGLKGEHVWLSLPKFEVRPAMSLSLGEDLIALGMPLAFDGGKADFTGMANPARAAERLAIAKVFHKGFVKVDEKGTEAAAASAVMMAETSAIAGGEPPLRIQVDRPFLFLIRDNAAGLVLFLGRVTDPEPAVSKGDRGSPLRQIRAWV